MPVERVRHGATTAWVETFVAFLLSSGISIESALYALIVRALEARDQPTKERTGFLRRVRAVRVAEGR